MTVLSFFNWLNNDIFALPATLLFFGIAVYFTFSTGFLQFRGFSYFLRLILQGVRERKEIGKNRMKTISSFQALFTAMATTIGMGNVVGPSVAIITGGPGALFWLLIYMFFGSATKFVEVVYALHTRVKLPNGFVLGGPMQYLKKVHPFLSYWYSSVMIFLFMGWSSLQSNTFANIFYLEQVPTWMSGLVLSLFAFVTLLGGAKRIGSLMSKLVPLMFVFYVSFALLILFKDFGALANAFSLIFSSILSPAAAFGGFIGATVFKAVQYGVYKSIYISEAGVGSSAIPHAIADTEHPIDQGILAMFSMAADAMLSLISGLLVLVTGVWAQAGAFRSTLVYEVFKYHSSTFGQLVLLISLSLFILTTVVGNSFNGTRCFAWLTNDRWTNLYILGTVTAIFFGALLPMPLVWEIMDTLLTLVAIPNLIGILILQYKYPQVLKFSSK